MLLSSTRDSRIEKTFFEKAPSSEFLAALATSIDVLSMRSATASA